MDLGKECGVTQWRCAHVWASFCVCSWMQRMFVPALRSPAPTPCSLCQVNESCWDKHFQVMASFIPSERGSPGAKIQLCCMQGYFKKEMLEKQNRISTTTKMNDCDCFFRSHLSKLCFIRKSKKCYQKLEQWFKNGSWAQDMKTVQTHGIFALTAERCCRWENVLDLFTVW